MKLFCNVYPGGEIKNSLMGSHIADTHNEYTFKLDIDEETAKDFCISKYEIHVPTGTLKRKDESKSDT